MILNKSNRKNTSTVVPLQLLLCLFALYFTKGSAQTDNPIQDTAKGIIQTPIANVNLDDISVYAYHQECSLTTSNSSRKWCTEVTLERIILQHYSWPSIKDSSTFKNREIYTLTIQIDTAGSIIDLKIEGGSNATVNQAIINAVKKSGVRFIPAIGKSTSKSPFTYSLKLREFDFLSPHKGPTELQVPAQLTDEELEKRDNGNATSGYRIN